VSSSSGSSLAARLWRLLVEVLALLDHRSIGGVMIITSESS
jgi:hypothetical protein